MLTLYVCVLCIFIFLYEYTHTCIYLGNIYNLYYIWFISLKYLKYLKYTRVCSYVLYIYYVNTNFSIVINLFDSTNIYIYNKYLYKYMKASVVNNFEHLFVHFKITYFYAEIKILTFVLHIGYHTHKYLYKLYIQYSITPPPPHTHTHTHAHFLSRSNIYKSLE